jgi:predicted nucleic acid-binding protein
MAKQRLYFDTSVFGGVFDEEFQEASKQLFERVMSGDICCVYSEITEAEILKAPKQVRDFFKSLPAENVEKVEVVDEILALATKYVEENVVGQTSFDDCVHIAAATVHKADILVSWNFKHIVNIYRIRGYNSVNARLNYCTLEIRSPKEIMVYENK